MTKKIKKSHPGGRHIKKPKKFCRTTPCAECPFRNDIEPYLREGRARSIATAIIKDSSFHCHKTVDYSGDNQGVVTADSEECAGSVIVQEKMGRANQAMRIAERLGWYDRNLMNMDAPVFANLRQFIEHHGGRPLSQPDPPEEQTDSPTVWRPV